MATVKKKKKKAVSKTKAKKRLKKTKPFRKLKKTIRKPKPKISVKPRKAVKKTKPVAAIKEISKPPAENEIFVGKIVHYFPHVNAGIVEITEGNLKIGDVVHIKGATTDCEQGITSMQIQHESITEAKAGDVIGLGVASRVRTHDFVYKKIK